MKLLITSIITVASLSACAPMPTMSFVPDDVHPASKKAKAELKTVTISIAKEDERQGRLLVGFGGNTFESSFKSEFKNALEEALAKSAIFDDLNERKVSLTAKVMEHDHPNFSVSFETTTTVRYEIYDRRDGKLIFKKDITSKGETPANYAFAGNIRATESRNRSMRNNISLFISTLQNSDLN